jgi:hypothetical protein
MTNIILSDEEIRKFITDLDNAWELKDGKIVTRKF